MRTHLRGLCICTLRQDDRKDPKYVRFREEMLRIYCISLSLALYTAGCS
jgi:hypothetical protein